MLPEVTRFNDIFLDNGDSVLSGAGESFIHLKSHKSVDSGLARWQGRRVFIKKYPKPGSPFAVFKALFRGSAAYNAIRGAQLLNSGGFQTPKALGLVEKRVFCRYKRSAAIFEDMSAYPQAAVALLRLKGRDRLIFIKSFACEAARMHALGLFHGDMNLHNVLVMGGENPKFIWTDNRRTQRIFLFPERGRIRNLSQLLAHADYLGRYSKLRFLSFYRRELKISRKRIVSIAGKVIRRMNGRHFRGEMPACCRGALREAATDSCNAPS